MPLINKIFATREELREHRSRFPKVTPADCDYCKPDHKFYGPGWVYLGNNGPIGSCPVCNPNGATPRKR